MAALMVEMLGNLSAVWKAGVLAWMTAGSLVVELVLRWACVKAVKKVDELDSRKVDRMAEHLVAEWVE
jgi:hypothetical protein